MKYVTSTIRQDYTKLQGKINATKRKGENKFTRLGDFFPTLPADVRQRAEGFHE